MSELFENLQSLAIGLRAELDEGRTEFSLSGSEVYCILDAVRELKDCSRTEFVCPGCGGKNYRVVVSNGDRECTGNFGKPCWRGSQSEFEANRFTVITLPNTEQDESTE